jgi:DNA topoisomerase-1
MRAPVKDPDGNRSIVKFARKTKEQYVMTENDDGKPSGWRADYVNGKWVETEKTTKPRKKKVVKKKAKKAAKG